MERIRPETGRTPVQRLGELIEGRDLEQLGLEEWGRIEEAVSAVRLGLLEKRRQEGLARIRTECEQIDVDPKEVSAYFGGKRASRTKQRMKKGKPKYRDPATGRTWTGHGARPEWMRSFEEGGGDREALRVGREGRAQDASG